MADLGDDSRSSWAPLQGGGPGGGDGLLPLLRYSHIFASTVREVLQLRLLQEATPHPLTPSQLHLLKLLRANGRHPVGRLAELLGVSAPAATKNMDKLERLGLVERHRAEGDRRTTLLSATAAGCELAERCERLEAARVGDATAGFAREEIEGFARLLERFSLSLLQARALEDGPCLRCAAHIEAGCPVGVVLGGCPYEAFQAPRWGGAAAKGAT